MLYNINYIQGQPIIVKEVVDKQILYDQMQFSINLISKNNIYKSYSSNNNKSMQINIYIVNSLKADLIIDINNI